LRWLPISMSVASFFLPVISLLSTRVSFPVGTNFASPEISGTHIQAQEQIYFQLQFGSELLPEDVSGFWLLPSANMVQICSDPERVDGKSICRLAGTHAGNSFRP